MLYVLIAYFWPDLTREEIKKFMLLTAIFFLIIQSYWMLRIARDTIFMTIAFPESFGWPALQGAFYQPLAKMISVLFIAIVLGFYSRLVDLYARHQLFYIICSAYMIIFSIFFLIFIFYHNPAFFYLSEESMGWQALALAGWSVYFSIESAGSLLIALFWSYAVSITNTDTAKVGFPMILTGGQVGAITGSFVSYVMSGSLPVALFFVPVVSNLAIVMALVYYVRSFVIEHQPSPSELSIIKEPKESSSFFKNFTEGLQLIFTRSYLRGIFIISTVYEIITVIVEYQMNRQALVVEPYAHAQGYAAFQSLFGITTNTISFLIVLLGTSHLLTRFGLLFCLMLYPAVIACVLVSLFLASSMQLSAGLFLWFLFCATVIIKAFNFAVNEPSKHIVYIPTSRAIQFKAKGWIDTFGGRFSKMAGAQVTNLFKENLVSLLHYGTGLSLLFALFGFGAAYFVGRENQRLTSDQKIID